MSDPILGSDTRVELQSVIDRLLGPIAAPRILEAGCGSVTNIAIPNGSHVTGVDVSQEELDNNSNLSERILADIQSYDFGPDQYDLIVCWDVLEHLPYPERALDGFARALKPGGLLLIKIPNRNSLKATTVRLTPYWFHRPAYKLLYGRRFGSPGIIPFCTFFRPSMAPKSITVFAERSALQPEFCQMYESKVQRRLRKKLGIGDRLVAVGEWFVRSCSFGNLTLVWSECTYLYRKNIARVITN